MSPATSGTLGTDSTELGHYDQKLSRSLSLRGNILITLSSVTPASSVFIIIPAVLAAIGGASFVAFIASAVVGIFMAYCYAELSSAFPIAGGEYSFAARVLGKDTGFALFLMNAISLILIIGVIALGTGQYLAAAFSGADSKWAGVIVIIVCSVIAVMNIRANAWVTGTFLILEMAALVVLTALGFLHVTQPVSTLFHAQTVGGKGVLTGVGLGLVSAQMATAVFAYNGYGAAVYFAEETRDASRGIARVIMWSLAITVVAELVPMTAVLLGTPSMTDLLSSSAPMQYFVTARGGSGLNTTISLMIAIAIINAVVAITLQGWPNPVRRSAGPRLPGPGELVLRLRTPETPDAVASHVVRRRGSSRRGRHRAVELTDHRHRRQPRRAVPDRRAVRDRRPSQRHDRPRALPDAVVAPRPSRRHRRLGLCCLRGMESQPLAGDHRGDRARSQGTSTTTRTSMRDGPPGGRCPPPRERTMFRRRLAGY